MNDDTGVPAAVFALKPEWADLILSGAKTVEIRRGRMKRMIGRMLIYRTGTGLIVGEARVKGMHAAPPETIWRGYGTESRIPKNLFDEYAKGADRLYAYRLENPIRYGKPKTLSDIGLTRVLNRSATPCLGLEVFEVSNLRRCRTHGSTVFAPVVRGEDPDREAALRTASEHSADRGGNRPGQVHGVTRAEARPVVRVQRERVVPSLPAETAEKTGPEPAMEGLN